MTPLANQLLDSCPGGLAERLAAVVRSRFPLAMAVYAFGSQVQGNAHASSDRDAIPGHHHRTAFVVRRFAGRFV